MTPRELARVGGYWTFYNHPSMDFRLDGIDVRTNLFMTERVHPPGAAMALGPAAEADARASATDSSE